MPIFKVPYTVKGECYVQAVSPDDAIDEAEFAPVSDIVESNYSDCSFEADEMNVEEVKGIPASARLL